MYRIPYRTVDSNIIIHYVEHALLSAPLVLPPYLSLPRLLPSSDRNARVLGLQGRWEDETRARPSYTSYALYKNSSNVPNPAIQISHVYDDALGVKGFTCNSFSVSPRISCVRCVAKHPVANARAASLPALLYSGAGHQPGCTRWHIGRCHKVLHLHEVI